MMLNVKYTIEVVIIGTINDTGYRSKRFSFWLVEYFGFFLFPTPCIFVGQYSVHAITWEGFESTSL